MANATQYTQKGLLDHTIGLTEFVASDYGVYLALLAANPGETGSLASEITGGSYARVEITSKMAETVLASGVAVNDVAIVFPAPTADWGLVPYWAVCDDASGGNALFYGALTSPILVSSGDYPPNFSEGAFMLTAPFATGVSDATAYLAKKWLDHALDIASFAMPTTLYLGAFTSDPGSAGSQAGEVVGGNYGRQSLASKMGAAVLETGIAVNNQNISFADPTANWGTVSHFGLLDASSGGTMLFRRGRESALIVAAGGVPLSVGSGQLALQAA